MKTAKKNKYLEMCKQVFLSMSGDDGYTYKELEEKTWFQGRGIRSAYGYLKKLWVTETRVAYRNEKSVWRRMFRKSDEFIQEWLANGTIDKRYLKVMA